MVSYRGMKQDGAVEVITASGGGVQCTCPPNTVWQFSIVGGKQVAWACVFCPSGASGNGDCTSLCRTGFYGDPAKSGYGGRCQSCPYAYTPSLPGGAPSSTTGPNPAGGTRAQCTTCVKAAKKVGEDWSGAAVCVPCAANTWSSGGDCNTCAPLYTGSPGSCSKW